MRLIFPTIISAVTSAILPGAAWSQSLTGNVGSAAISDGELAVEFRTGLQDDGDLAARFHYDQAVSEWYQLRVITSFRRPDDGNFEYSGLTFENWFQWAEERQDQSGFNGGLRLAYTFVDGGGPDEAALRFTLTDKFAGEWEWRANAIAEIETGHGRDQGAALETRLQLTRAAKMKWLNTDDWRVGVETFSEYGSTEKFANLAQQAHQAGPVLKAEWPGGIYIQLAVRAGLTRSADDVMGKVFIGREF